MIIPINSLKVLTSCQGSRPLFGTGMALALAAAGTLGGCSEDGFTLGKLTQEDSWLQPDSMPVDVLFVVDNSLSMQEEGGEQDKVADAFEQFIQGLEADTIEFHIGVITTDMNNTDLPGAMGKLVDVEGVRYITYDMAPEEYRSIFTQMIGRVGEADGSGFEKGLWAAKEALFPYDQGGQSGEGGWNAGFLRDDARLAIVFVSDEDDCSEDGQVDMVKADECYTRYSELRPVSDYVNDYYSLKRRDSDVVVSSIVGPVGLEQDDPCAVASGEGKRYLTATSAMNGVAGSICLSDFSDILNRMGLEAASKSSVFRLSREPVVSTLTLTLDGQSIPQTEGDQTLWTYVGTNTDSDPNDFEIHEIYCSGRAIPERGSTINIKYELK